jgi:hypothetical protein
MQTVIGIVICLIVGIYFLIGFMDTYNGGGITAYNEGLENKVDPVTVPLTSAVANSTHAVATMNTIVPAINNGDNKTLYIKHIDNLLDYCDLSILEIINSAEPNSTTGKYDINVLNQIRTYSQIKDALIGSISFLEVS